MSFITSTAGDQFEGDRPKQIKKVTVWVTMPTGKDFKYEHLAPKDDKGVQQCYAMSGVNRILTDCRKALRKRFPGWKFKLEKTDETVDSYEFRFTCTSSTLDVKSRVMN